MQKLAVVTGAGGNIGTEISEHLIQLGMKVLGVGRKADQLQILSDRGVLTAGFVVGDVREPNTWDRVMSHAESNDSHVSVLVNNAGVSPKKDGKRTPGVEIDPREWDEVIAINLTAPLLGIQACAPGMMKHNWGRIINISSLAARQGSMVAGVHYTASKAGLLGLTKNFAKELAAYSITVNAVSPGLIDSEMTAQSPGREAFVSSIPLGRIGLPRDVASAVAFLASDGAEYLTGISLDINGGSYIAP